MWLLLAVDSQRGVVSIPPEVKGDSAVLENGSHRISAPMASFDVAGPDSEKLRQFHPSRRE